MNPEQIFKEFQENKLSTQSACDLLIFLIESNNNEDLRLKSLKTLTKIEVNPHKIFSFLENLLISDSNQLLRLEAFNIIKNKFKVKALKPILYSINNEEDLFLINLIEFLSEINQKKCKEIIVKILIKKEENLKSEKDDLKNLNLTQLKKIFLNYLFNKSVDALYFHRHKIPIAFDFFEIE